MALVYEQVKLLSDKKGAADALNALKTVVDNKKKLTEMASALPAIMEHVGGKDKPTVTAAEELSTLIFDTIEPWALPYTLQFLDKALDSKSKPPVKEHALKIVKTLCAKHPGPFAREIEWLVFPVAFLCNDLKKSVSSLAKEVMNDMCRCCGNNDLIGKPATDNFAGSKSFMPTIVTACEKPNQIETCVEDLAGCKFVQNVVAPALAVLKPVLWRGLTTKNEATQRRCCVIIDNMCKLIDDPREGYPLFTSGYGNEGIYNLVKRRFDEMTQPDCRDMAEKAMKTMEKIHRDGERKPIDFKKIGNKHFGGESGVGCFSTYEINFCQKTLNALNEALNFDVNTWKTAFAPWLPAASVETMVAEVEVADVQEEVVFVDDSPEPDLYKGRFSLAFGTITLLRDTMLHLKKNKFYGMLGPTNCGKTSLMSAIAEERLEGFPTRDELSTIFVQHDIAERRLLPDGATDEAGVHWPIGKFNIDLNGMEYCVDAVNNTYKKQPPIALEQAANALNELGFKNKTRGWNVKAAASMERPITDYSGGWKVKMQLACAQLVESDIIMIDDPTGHMDTKNVAWMKSWLNAFPGTIIAASANSEFLDEMCTHIIDFQDCKLRQFKGTKGTVLSKYVEENPEKEAYFQLSDKNEKWVFPKPGPLEGVKSRGRAVLKMNGVNFKYPAHETWTVENISLSVSQASRIAVVGPNGAGKSTAIKLLIGELKNVTGTVWRHSGMRMAYVAQHAFHHLEKHLDKTPKDYILWRFAGNDDRESLENQTKEVNVDEEALRAVKWCVDNKSGVVRKCVEGEKGDVPVTPDTILNRRKNKQKKYEYETKFMFKPIEAAVWIERDTLITMGYEKLVFREDEKQAAMAGLLLKPLDGPSVEKELMNFGLDSEAASHNPIASLSGGQKVKVVLAAAMWQNPHILILDEPTNYLDRDGLGALVCGLAEFLGGVVIISHNFEFTDKCCTQKWIMEQGRLREEGDVAFGDEEIVVEEGADEVFDAAGNKIDVNKSKKLSDKDLKKLLKEHKKKNTMSEPEMWEAQDKLAEYKQQMEDNADAKK